MCIDLPTEPFGRPLPPADVARLRAHISSLAADSSVEWRLEPLRPWNDSEGDLAERWIRTGVIDYEIFYWAALHEIGHILLELPTQDEHGRILYVNELSVWQWTIDAALIKPSRAVQAYLGGGAVDGYPWDPPKAELRQAIIEAFGPDGGDAYSFKPAPRSDPAT